MDTLVSASSVGCDIPEPLIQQLQDWVGRQASATAAAKHAPQSSEPHALSLITPHVFVSALWLLGQAGSVLPIKTLPAAVQHVQQLLQEGELAAGDVVHLLHGLAAQAPHVSTTLLGDVLAAADAALSELEGQHHMLAQLAWAMVKLGARPDTTWGRTFCNSLLKQLGDAAPEDLVIALMALAGLGVQMPINGRLAVSLYMQSHTCTQQQQESLALLGFSKQV